MDKSRFDRITRELLELRRMISGRSSAPQLAHSSFDSGPGHSIDEIDPATGQVVASYGTQYDGSHGVVPFTGPIPPMPSVPTLETLPAILIINWDGEFAGGPLEVATLDWSHAEVHASQETGFLADTAGTIVGTINTARGGKVTAAVGAGIWYVRLVSRSTSGKRSDATAQVMIEVLSSAGDTEAIEQDIADAVTRLEKAEKKFTVSNVVPSTTEGHTNGDVWWRKDDTTEAIIGTWVLVGGEWEPRGISVEQVVPGGGTMTSGLIDLLFAEVVVAQTAAFTEAFIGGTVIEEGAITAAKITASEELTAKVAQFLVVNAEQINTAELWADTAWIAAAKTHILQVLQHTNGEGYTSTVTGQGLKVSYTATDGRVVDVIRLGTFGADYLGISDGTGKALAAVTGDGGIQAQTTYVDGNSWVAGKKVQTNTFQDVPKGEVFFHSHSYVSGNTPASFTSTVVTTPVSVLVGMVEVKQGRAYEITGTLAVTPSVDSRFQAHISHAAGSVTVLDANPQTSVATERLGPQGGFASPLIQAAQPHTIQFSVRYASDATATPADRRVKLNLNVARTGAAGNFTVQYAELKVTDLGYKGQEGVTGHPSNSSGTTVSYLTTMPLTTTTFTADKIWNYQMNAAGTSFARVGSGTDTVARQGRMITERQYKSAARFNTLLSTLSGTDIVGIREMYLELTPLNWANGYGTMDLAFSTINYDSNSNWPSGDPDTGGSGSEIMNRATRIVLGAWPEGVKRTIAIPQEMWPYFGIGRPSPFNTGVMWLTFGGSKYPGSVLGESQYGMVIPQADIALRVVHRRTV